MRALRQALPVSTLLATLVVAGGACEKSQASPADAGANDDAAVYLCTIAAPTACPDPPPHYPDIQPIIQRACVPCHQGLPGGNWPLLQYSHVADWQDVIRGHLLACTMPPPDAGVPMTDEERTAILTWILCGFQE